MLLRKIEEAGAVLTGSLHSSAGGAAAEAWNHCQQSLFKTACKPHPFGVFLLMQCWRMLIR